MAPVQFAVFLHPSPSETGVLARRKRLKPTQNIDNYWRAPKPIEYLYIRVLFSRDIGLFIRHITVA